MAKHPENPDDFFKRRGGGGSAPARKAQDPDAFFGKKGGTPGGGKDGKASIFGQLRNIVTSIPSALARTGEAAGREVVQDVGIDTSHGIGGALKSLIIEPKNKPAEQPRTTSERALDFLGQNPRRGARPGESTTDVFRRTHPLSAQLDESVRQTAGHVRHPSTIARDYSGPSGVAAALNDILNVGLASSVAGKALAPAAGARVGAAASVAERAAQAADVAQEARTYAQTVRGAAERGVAAPAVAEETAMEAARLAETARGARAGAEDATRAAGRSPVVVAHRVATDVAKLGERGAAAPAAPYTFALQRVLGPLARGAVGAVERSDTLAPLVERGRAAAADAAKTLRVDPTSRSARELIDTSQQELADYAERIASVSREAEKYVRTPAENQALHLLGTAEAHPGGGLDVALRAGLPRPALEQLVEAVYEGRGDVPTPEAIGLAAAVKQGRAPAEVADRLTKAVEVTGENLRAVRQAEELAGKGRRRPLHPEQVGDEYLSLPQEEVRASYEPRIERAQSQAGKLRERLTAAEGRRVLSPEEAANPAKAVADAQARALDIARRAVEADRDHARLAAGIQPGRALSDEELTTALGDRVFRELRRPGTAARAEEAISKRRSKLYAQAGIDTSLAEHGRTGAAGALESLVAGQEPVRVPALSQAPLRRVETAAGNRALADEAAAQAQRYGARAQEAEGVAQSAAIRAERPVPAGRLPGNATEPVERAAVAVARARDRVAESVRSVQDTVARVADQARHKSKGDVATLVADLEKDAAKEGRQLERRVVEARETVRSESRRRATQLKGEIDSRFFSEGHLQRPTEAMRQSWIKTGRVPAEWDWLVELSADKRRLRYLVDEPTREALFGLGSYEDKPFVNAAGEARTRRVKVQGAGSTPDTFFGRLAHGEVPDYGAHVDEFRQLHGAYRDLDRLAKRQGDGRALYDLAGEVHGGLLDDADAVIFDASLTPKEAAQRLVAEHPDITPSGAFANEVRTTAEDYHARAAQTAVETAQLRAQRGEGPLAKALQSQEAAGARVPTAEAKLGAARGKAVASIAEPARQFGVKQGREVGATFSRAKLLSNLAENASARAARYGAKVPADLAGLRAEALGRAAREGLEAGLSAGKREAEYGQAARLLGLKEREIARLSKAEADRVAQVADSIGGAPAKYRPVLVTNRRAQEVLRSYADAMDKAVPAAGDYLRNAAAEIPVTLKELTDAGVDPEHFIGGTPKGSKARPMPTPERPPTIRKLRSEKQRAERATVRSIRGQAQLEFERARDVVSNELARKLGDRFGTNAERENLGNLKGRELESEMADRGYVAWDPYNPFGKPAHIDANTVFLPEQLARGHRAYFGAPGVAEKVVRATYDPLVRTFRHSVLALSPSWHVGNAVGNTLMATLAGGVRPWELPGLVAEAKRALAAGEIPARILRAGPAWEDIAYLQSHGELGLAGGARRFHPIERSYRINTWVDDLGHAVDYLKARKGGLDEAAAIRESLKVMGDFSKLSPFEQRVVRRIVPFWTWQRHITQLVFHLAIEHPLRAAWVLHLGAMFGDDQSELPGWLRGSLKLADGRYLQLNRLNPYGDFGSLFSGAGIARSLSPVIRTAVGYGLKANLNRPSLEFSHPPGTEPVAEQGTGRVRPSLPRLIEGNFFRQGSQLRDLVRTARGRPATARYDTGQPILVDHKKIAEDDRGPSALGLSILGLPTPRDVDLAALQKRRADKERRRAKTVTNYERRASR